MNKVMICFLESKESIGELLEFGLSVALSFSNRYTLNYQGLFTERGKIASKNQLGDNGAGFSTADSGRRGIDLCWAEGRPSSNDG